MGDGTVSYVDLDSIYTPETKTEVPDLRRLPKTMLAHAMNDFIDMGIHEYSV